MVRPWSSTATQSSNLHLPTHVKIVEVGPRDGLQNEKQVRVRTEAQRPCDVAQLSDLALFRQHTMRARGCWSARATSCSFSCSTSLTRKGEKEKKGLEWVAVLLLCAVASCSCYSCSCSPNTCFAHISLFILTILPPPAPAGTDRH